MTRADAIAGCLSLQCACINILSWSDGMQEIHRLTSETRIHMQRRIDARVATDPLCTVSAHAFREAFLPKLVTILRLTSKMKQVTYTRQTCRQTKLFDVRLRGVIIRSSRRASSCLLGIYHRDGIAKDEERRNSDLALPLLVR